MSEFLRDHGALADQTPAHFGAHIIKYVNERLVHHQAVNEAHRVTLRVAKSTTEDPPSLSTHTPEQEAAYQAYLAVGTGGKHLPAKKSKVVAPAPASAGAPRAPCQLTAGAPPFYCCWTHAVDFSLSYPHYSHECKARATGHKRMATLANQMGGKPA